MFNGGLIQSLTRWLCVWTSLLINVRPFPLPYIAVTLNFQTFVTLFLFSFLMSLSITVFPSVKYTPRGLARVLHFEIICRVAGYDPSLLSFRRFFCLEKNGGCFTFETSVDTCLISSMVTTLGSWKDRFFWVFESIIPFKMVWRHPVISALDFIKSDDMFDVVFTDAASAEGEDVVVRGSEHRFEASGYDNVPNVKGFVKVVASKASTRRSTLRNGAGQPSSSETIDLGDDVEVSEDLEIPAEGKKGELPLVVDKDNKAVGKKVGGLKPLGKALESSSNVDLGEIYMPNWKVTIVDSFKSRFRKRMQEHEAFSKKRDAMKANMTALKKGK
ncbi:hypothetical protein HanPI659440_Chr08g0311451 [Helianthus annuus]|nr:hypothetical protein HanPI659440_Chr08g0311451 [Helianthus annuus]